MDDGRTEKRTSRLPGGGKLRIRRGLGGWLGEFVTAALEEVGRAAPVGPDRAARAFADALHGVARSDRHEEIDLAHVRHLAAGKAASAEASYDIGVAFRKLGVPWSSGTLALFAGGFPWHGYGVLGMFVTLAPAPLVDETLPFIEIVGTSAYAVAADDRDARAAASASDAALDALDGAKRAWMTTGTRDLLVPAAFSRLVQMSLVWTAEDDPSFGASGEAWRVLVDWVRRRRADAEWEALGPERQVARLNETLERLRADARARRGTVPGTE